VSARALGLGLVLVCLAVPARGDASMLDLYGFGPRAVGMGSAMTAVGGDYSATFYNPGALTEARRSTVSAGYVVAAPLFDISLGRPVCQDSHALCTSRFGGPGGYSSRAPVLPETTQGVTIGWSKPLGGIFKKHVALGAGLFVPTRRIARIDGQDPQSPQFYLYQGLPDKLVMLGSAAWEPVSWLSMGLGVQVFAQLAGNVQLGMDPTNHRLDKTEIQVEQRPITRLVAGVLLRPYGGFRLGISYRQAMDLQFALPVTIALGKPLALVLDVSQIALYTPHTFTLGGAWQLARAPLLVSAQVDWALWSSAPDPSLRVAVDIRGPVLDSIGLGDVADVGTETAPISLGLRDTITPRLGLEWRPMTRLALRGGYFYRPTPAPRATNLYNYLDNDVHALSVGAGWSFGDPDAPDPDNAADMPRHLHPLGVDFGAQILSLRRRTVTKSDANDPVGALSHGGMAIYVGMALQGSY